MKNGRLGSTRPEAAWQASGGRGKCAPLNGPLCSVASRPRAPCAAPGPSATVCLLGQVAPVGRPASSALARSLARWLASSLRASYKEKATCELEEEEKEGEKVLLQVASAKALAATGRVEHLQRQRRTRDNTAWESC